MTPRPRVAVVSAQPSPLVADLQRLARAPLVELFGDLWSEAESMRRFQPAALFVEAGELSAEALGALRLLRGWMPAVGLVLVCPPQREAGLGDTALLLGAALLPQPTRPGALALALEAALHAGASRFEDTVGDLARGLADEVNNPLQLAAGYVRLLEAGLDPADTERREHISLIANGLRRIKETVAKLDLLSSVRETKQVIRRIDLAQLVVRVDAEEAAGDSLLEAPPAPATVEGHPRLLEGLVRQLCRAGLALRGAGGRVRLRIETADGKVALRMLLDAARLAEWRLPRSFDPYYLSRVVAGSPDGLSLALVDVLARCHGGRATARRDAAGAVHLRVDLVAAPA